MTPTHLMTRPAKSSLGSTPISANTSSESKSGPAFVSGAASHLAQASDSGSRTDLTPSSKRNLGYPFQEKQFPSTSIPSSRRLSRFVQPDPIRTKAPSSLSDASIAPSPGTENRMAIHSSSFNSFKIGSAVVDQRPGSPAELETWLRIQGHCMEPLLRSGDLVRIDDHREVENGSLVAARIRGEIHVRWLYRESGFLSLNPTHPAFSPIVIEPDMEMEILGVIARIVRVER